MSINKKMAIFAPINQTLQKVFLLKWSIWTKHTINQRMKDSIQEQNDALKKEHQSKIDVMTKELNASSDYDKCIQMYSDYQKLKSAVIKFQQYIPKYTDLDSLNIDVAKLTEKLSKQIKELMTFMKNEWNDHLVSLKLKKKTEKSYVYILTEMGMDKSNMELYGDSDEGKESYGVKTTNDEDTKNFIQRLVNGIDDFYSTEYDEDIINFMRRLFTQKKDFYEDQLIEYFRQEIDEIYKYPKEFDKYIICIEDVEIVDKFIGIYENYPRDFDIIGFHSVKAFIELLYFFKKYDVINLVASYLYFWNSTDEHGYTKVLEKGMTTLILKYNHPSEGYCSNCVDEHGGVAKETWYTCDCDRYEDNNHFDYIDSGDVDECFGKDINELETYGVFYNHS